MALEQKPEHGHGHKVEVRQLLQLEATLRHPEIPDAVRGLEGIKAGDALLKEKQASGVLIGGLAEAVWRYQQPRDLARRKDTDIVVVTPGESIEDFEGGIDWWQYRTEHLEVTTEIGKTVGPIGWWENANGVILGFRMQIEGNLEPGLYILSPTEVVSMRVNETMVHMGRTEIDSASLEIFERKLEERLGKKILNNAVSEMVQGKVADPMYNRSRHINLRTTSLPQGEYVAIKGFREGLKDD